MPETPRAITPLDPDEQRVALVDDITRALVDTRWGPYDENDRSCDRDLWELAKEGDRYGSADDVCFVLDHLRTLPIEARLIAVGIAYEQVSPDGVRLSDAE